ncbi:aspartyl-phosphate phosphatase Spo0E family protein [Filibacter tadaridae]|uniref:Spo0E like sporulation regulatory protein n=1 Tax=Filibacter tadaridae TaxID=2483811 RepID=A0A3P5XPZ8_9BACL|nr:aspartyl-phosphate phosphatase Spo0E family protein [Filibacter tadaridae]VDC29925.1 Spo0E like sporulation regulatory protein [Filibacter tadaridae]
MRSKVETDIETTRKKLIAMAEKEGLSSPETLKLSHRLDELINQFQTAESKRLPNVD